MKKQRIVVEMLDGTEETLTALPIDIVAWERKHKRSIDKLDTYEQQAWLAWHVAKRAGLTGEDFEPFLHGLAGIDDPDATDDEGDEGSDPLQTPSE